MRRKSVLIVLVIVALGVIGTGLSTLYERNEWTESQDQSSVTFKASYGFPLAWLGYSQNYSLLKTLEPIIPFKPPKIYWFSLGLFLLDAAFWFAIGSFVSLAVVKSATRVRKARPSKIQSAI